MIRPFNKRSFFRVVYPANARPALKNLNAEVFNISQKGVNLCVKNEEFSKFDFVEGAELRLEIIFHDGKQISVNGKIVDIVNRINNKIKSVCVYVPEGIPPQIIASEQAYLLNHFRSFSRLMKFKDEIALNNKL